MAAHNGVTTGTASSNTVSVDHTPTTGVTHIVLVGRWWDGDQGIDELSWRGNDVEADIVVDELTNSVRQIIAVVADTATSEGEAILDINFGAEVSLEVHDFSGVDSVRTNSADGATGSSSTPSVTIDPTDSDDLVFAAACTKSWPSSGHDLTGDEEEVVDGYPVGSASTSRFIACTQIDQTPGGSTKAMGFSGYNWDWCAGGVSFTEAAVASSTSHLTTLGVG